MTRVLVALVVGALMAAVWVLAPTEEPIDLGSPVVEGAPLAQTCIAVVGRDDTGAVAIASDRSALLGLSSVAAGGVVSEIGARVSLAGGVTVPFDRLTASGTVGVLVEFLSPSTAAATVQRGPGGSAAATCTPESSGSLLIPGGSTRSEELLRLVLANPYASDAVVAVTSSSESGIDSASELESVVVPARSTVIRDLESLLPLRSSLSVNVAVLEGAVHASLLQSGEGDRMWLEGVEPSGEWWVPVPALGEVAGRLVVSTAAPLPVDFEVDVWGAEGILEAAVEDTIPAQGHVDIPVDSIAEGITAMRVFAENPVVATLVFEGPGVRAGGPGTEVVGFEWQVPGVTVAGGGTLWIFNPTEFDGLAVVQPLGPGEDAAEIALPAAGLVSWPVSQGGTGVAVSSSIEISVVWTAASENGVAFARGVPVGG